MKKLLLLPVCLVALATAIQAQVKEPPPPPPPPPLPKIELTKYVSPAKELEGFYKRNPDVSILYWKSKQQIVVGHKNKAKFVYDMTNKEEAGTFKEKYGDVVLKTPPPPPPKGN